MVLLILLIFGPGVLHGPSPAPREPNQNVQGYGSPEQTSRDIYKQGSNPIRPTPSNRAFADNSDNRQQLSNNTKSQAAQRYWPDWWTVITTAPIVIFSACLVWLARRQSLAMEQQAVYMRDALAETKKAADAAVLAIELGERANIVVLQARFAFTGHQNTIDITLRNDGRTPARTVIISGNIRDGRADRIAFGHEIVPTEPVTVAGDCERVIPLDFVIPISTEEKEQIDLYRPEIPRPQLRFEIRYVDIFNKSRYRNIDAIYHHPYGEFYLDQSDAD